MTRTKNRFRIERKVNIIISLWRSLLAEVSHRPHSIDDVLDLVAVYHQVGAELEAQFEGLLGTGEEEADNE